ncbi:thermopsin family protease, partial [Ferroplasma sp.]|uniref:thermopsin family protease n=1 Tax=Ferroplasma sp. TaxID=2591003 RepID=UPI00263396D4
MHVKKFLVVFVVFMSVIGFSMIVLPSSLNDNGNHNLNNSVDDKYSQISSHNNSIPSKVNSYVNHVKSNINYNVTKFNKSTSYNSSNSNLSNLLFLPNKDAKAFYKIVDGTVTPLYTNAPAPMGIGDFGVTNDSTGSLVSQNFNTTSFEGVVNISSLNALYSSKCFEPRSVSFQLNTVLANVTLFGITNYTMWTQNVIVYSTRTHELSFEDNLWNFSSPASYLTSNAIYKSIGNNYMYPGVHIAIGPTYKLDTPFLVYLYINTTNIDSRNAVYFNYSIPALSESGTYNEVIFNSTYGMPSSYKTPMDYFEVNGNKVTPTGYLLYDAELMIGGPGGGSTTQIYNVNGNMKLLFLNDTTKAYTSVPSAYDYGTDTGETSQGVSVYYTGTTAHLSTGPSFLHGLWNITNNPGYITLEGKISPSNGYVFVNPGSHIYNSTAQWAATSISGSFDYKISPGTYSLQVLASDYEPHYINSLSGSSGAILSQSISLTKNTSYGVYTPLTAMNNSQLKNISYMGNGTASSPYMLLDSSPVIDPVFGLLNDFGYPEFAGIMLYNTSKYVSTVGITQPFVDAMPMPVDLYNASNVSLSGMSLYPDYIGDSLLIWYSNNDVISLNSFTAFGIGYINSSSDISYTSNYLDNSILYLCNDTTNIVNNEFYNSLLAGCNSDMNVMSNHVSGSTLSYTNGNTNSTANTFINSGEASFNNTLNAYDNNYISSYLYIHGDLNSNINNSLIINSLYFNVFGNGNMNNDTYLQSYIIDSYANIDINNVNFNETVMCSTNSDNTVNNSYGNMLSLGMYGNLSLNNDHLNNTELINEYNNLSANNSFLNESEYISLYSNNTVSNSTFINYVDYNIYGNNVYNNDKFTSNMYIPYINSEFIPDSLVLYGNSNVMNSLFYSKNTNVGSSIQIYYGTSTVENNMLKSDNVSLINNPTGYGSSILAYGGINVIKNNIFITINSPAKSIYDNYFADPAVMGNEYEYSVTFNKISPKNDTLWNLTVNGKTYTTDNSSILLIMSPGTYNYSASSYGYSKITGTVNVISSSVTVNLNFKLAPKYSVTFTETGLPSNTLWNVTLHGVTESSNTSSIVFNVVNGTYNYEIST